MSAILKDDRLTTRINVYNVPAVQAWHVDGLIPATHSNGSGYSGHSTAASAHNVEREEPCFITKSSCYTHKREHWITAVGNDPNVKAKVEGVLIQRRIVYANFTLDSPFNLSNLDRVLHAGLDKYGFFAVTGSLNTLEQLISMLEKDNERRQVSYDETFLDPIRFLDLKHPAIANPEYELVALHPQYMLPKGKILIAYNRKADGSVAHTAYVHGPDNTLRKYPGTLDDPRFPPFSFDYPRPSPPNPFLVILNAEIRFRRYLGQKQPPAFPLPADVMALLHLTIKLVELIYWDPVVRPNTYAAEMVQRMSPPSDAGMDFIDDEHAGEVLTLRARCGRGTLTKNWRDSRGTKRLRAIFTLGPIPL